jgi:hypothetical protein
MKINGELKPGRYTTGEVALLAHWVADCMALLQNHPECCRAMVVNLGLCKIEKIY